MSNFSKTFCTNSPISPLKVHVPGHVAPVTNNPFYKGKGGQHMFDTKFFKGGEYNPSKDKDFYKGGEDDSSDSTKQNAALDAIKAKMGHVGSVSWFSPGTKKGPVLKHCK